MNNDNDNTGGRSWFVANDVVPGFTPALASNITFSVSSEPAPVMVLDKDGMTYKGQRVEDAGEAHRAFLEVMEKMKRCL